MIHCAISLIFFIGMVYMSFAVDKSLISQRFVRSLSPEQFEQYQHVIKSRRRIYLEGFFIGLLLSYIAIRSKKEVGWKHVCLVGSITFLTVYFYYLLSPKPQLMVVSLQCQSQREEWAKIYKTMSFNYHMGLFLGVVGVILFTRGLCKRL